MFYWKIYQFIKTTSGTRVVYFLYTREFIDDVILVISLYYFIFHISYNKKNITWRAREVILSSWRLKDMNFIFSWQKRYFTHSLRSLVNIVLPLKNKIYIFAPPCNILYIYHLNSLALLCKIKDTLFINKIIVAKQISLIFY